MRRFDRVPSVATVSICCYFSSRTSHKECVPIEPLTSAATPSTPFAGLTELGDNPSEGPLTPSFLVDADRVVELLRVGVASEHMSWLAYTAHAAAMDSLRARPVAADFREHAEQELGHMRKLMGRMQQLGAEIVLDPMQLAKRSIHPHAVPGTLEDMVGYHLQAERRAVEFYRDAVQWLGDRDPTTRRLMEDVLAVEEQHARDLQDFADHA